MSDRQGEGEKRKGLKGKSEKRRREQIAPGVSKSRSSLAEGGKCRKKSLRCFPPASSRKKVPCCRTLQIYREKERGRRDKRHLLKFPPLFSVRIWVFFLFRALKPYAGECWEASLCAAQCAAGGGLYPMAWHLSMHGAVSHKGDIGSRRGGEVPHLSAIRRRPIKWIEI